MKKFLSLIFVLINTLSLYAAVSEYKIEDFTVLENKTVSLNTDWDFYWGKFVEYNSETKPDITVQVPSKWNTYDLDDETDRIAKTGKGSGTYRLKVTGLKPDTDYSFLTFKLAYTAFKAYADDKLIFTSGTPDADWDLTQMNQYNDFATFTSDSKGAVTLTFHVSNKVYRRGGLTNEVKIMETKKYKAKYFRKISSFGILSGILFTIVIYGLIIFGLTKDRANFYLSLFVLTILSRLIFETFPIVKFFFPQIPFSMQLRIEYMTPMLAPGLFTLYVDALNKNIFKFVKAWILALPSFIFIILDFVMPIQILNRVVPFYEIWIYISIAFDLIFIFINMIRQHDMISFSTAFTLIIIGFGALSQILLINGIDIYNGHNFLAESFILYAISQIILLAWLQNQNLVKEQNLSNYLEEVNKASYRFVPKELLNLFNKKDITELTAGQMHSSKMAILSADIRNFTTISEQHSEKEIFDMLNSYLKVIAPIIRKHNGMIEKYLGDGIIAIFSGKAENALLCAVEMQEQMVKLRKEFALKNFPEIKIGVGVHYGEMIIGTGGNSERISEIAISKAIDEAVKAEAATKEFMRPIIVTKAALIKAAKEVDSRNEKFSFKASKIKDRDDYYFIYSDKTGPVL